MSNSEWWDKLSPEEQQAERNAQASRSYQSLLFSANRTLTQKEREHSNVIIGVVIVAAIAVAAWWWHEGAWQEKLDRALTDCTVPMTDGSCVHWNLAALKMRQ